MCELHSLPCSLCPQVFFSLFRIVLERARLTKVGLVLDPLELPFRDFIWRELNVRYALLIPRIDCFLNLLLFCAHVFDGLIDHVELGSFLVFILYDLGRWDDEAVLVLEPDAEVGLLFLDFLAELDDIVCVFLALRNRASAVRVRGRAVQARG